MFRLLTLILLFSVFASVNAYAGMGMGISDGEFHMVDTDAEHDHLMGVFDLRERETFIQVTLTDDTDDNIPGDLVHIQIFNLASSCGENNFFDFYTPDDTHVYDLRNLTTNDGNDPGFILPDGAYGFVVVLFENEEGIGNLRMKDVNGYEYRTNLQAVGQPQATEPNSCDNEWWFNFNSEEGVVLSDIYGVVVVELDQFSDGAKLGPISENWMAPNVEIYNMDEVLFSCPELVFTCTDGTDPLIPDLLQIIADQDDSELGTIDPNSVNAYFGINESIPSSKGGPLVCPNNTISEGVVFFNEEKNDIEESYNDASVVIFVGLNDNSGRGSFDTAWQGESRFPDGNGGCP